jgi:hypothetical protein
LIYSSVFFRLDVPVEDDLRVAGFFAAVLRFTAGLDSSSACSSTSAGSFVTGAETAVDLRERAGFSTFLIAYSSFHQPSIKAS